MDATELVVLVEFGGDDIPDELGASPRLKLVLDYAEGEIRLGSLVVEGVIFVLLFQDIVETADKRINSIWIKEAVLVDFPDLFVGDLPELGDAKVEFEFIEFKLIGDLLVQKRVYPSERVLVFSLVLFFDDLLEKICGK